MFPNSLSLSLSLCSTFEQDGSVYSGEWSNGVQYTEKKGTLLRPDQSSYEGNWVNGKRHGMGEQRYPDGAVYVGQFANGFEHGNGSLTYPDRGYFEGRFRFGRRDGPGMFAPANVPTERGNFKDKFVYYNFSMPNDAVEGREEETTIRDIKYNRFVGDDFRPCSLNHTAAHALAKFIRDKEIRRRHLTGAKVKSKLPVYVRKGVINDYLETYHGDKRNERFREYAPTYAFTDTEEVRMNSVRMSIEAVEFFMYIISANVKLRKLQLTGNRLETESFALITGMIQRHTWTTLTCLDLSYNSIGITQQESDMVLHNISACCLASPQLTTLKIAGCRIKEHHASIIAELISLSKHLSHLDLGFNLLGAEGAEYVSEALEVNTTLTHLNLRQV